jgi:hypothetical protein
MVLMSMYTAPRRMPSTIPSGPSATRSTSGESGSIVMTNSTAAATSRGVTAVPRPAVVRAVTACGNHVVRDELVSLGEKVSRHRGAHRAQPMKPAIMTLA